MDFQTSSLNELRELAKLCRELGITRIRTKDGVELELSENLPFTPAHAIMTREIIEEEPVPDGMDPQKAADLKRLREQQRLLKTLFNDNN